MNETAELVWRFKFRQVWKGGTDVEDFQTGELTAFAHQFVERVREGESVRITYSYILGDEQMTVSFT